MRRTLLALLAAAAALTPTLAAAATSYPGDPYLVSGDQWYLGAAPGIGAVSGWCVSTGAGVTIAGLGTGADFSHPDLAGRLSVGARFTSGIGDPSLPDSTDQSAVSDDEGSGTAEAGLMVAATGNGQGIAGAAPASRELVVKVLDNAASGHSSDIAAGIDWAVRQGARVLDVDVGPRVQVTGSPGRIVNAVHAAAGRGVAVALASGGNFGAALSAAQLRELDGDALVVGALGPSGTPASYTVHFEGVNIWAPGGDSEGGSAQDAGHMLLTTAPLQPGPDQYQFVEGSGYAAALAAASLADLVGSGYSGATARSQVLETARRRGSVASLDLAAALGASHPCGTPARAQPTPLDAVPKNPTQPMYLNPTPGSDLSVNFVPPPGPAPPPPWLPVLIPPLILVIAGGAALWYWGRR